MKLNRKSSKLDTLPQAAARAHTKTCKISVSTYNQPNLESTQNQPSFLLLKLWVHFNFTARVTDLSSWLLLRESIVANPSVT
jgi:hypothetical protein